MKYLVVPCLLCVVLFAARGHSQEVKPAIPERFVGKWQDLKNQGHYVVITRERISRHRGPGGSAEVIPAGACTIRGDEVRFKVKSAMGTVNPRTGKVKAGSAYATMLRAGGTLVIREIPEQDFSGLPSGFAVTPLPNLHVFHKSALSPYQ